MRNVLADTSGLEASSPSRDLHLGDHAEVSTYDAGIGTAVARGQIVFVNAPGRAVGRDHFAHRNEASGCELDLTPCNTRGLCREALDYLPARGAPRVLELGPGAGVAAAELRRKLPDCRLETLSLTPINPYLWFDDTTGRAVPTTLRSEPYIDRQWIGPVEQSLPRIGGQFQFIYDCFGPVFWQMLIAARANDPEAAERLVGHLLRLLAPGGTLFVAASEGQLWLEGLLKRLGGPGDRYYFHRPRFEATEIRVCVLERGR